MTDFARRARICAIALFALIAIASPSVRAEPIANAYLGRWDMTLTTPQRVYASWLEISEREGRLHARMVGRWGHARELPQADIVDGHLRFVSAKADEGFKDRDLVFEGLRNGEAIVGTAFGPVGVHWTWRAQRAPTLARASPPQWGRPIRLFDGKSPSGWRPLARARKPWRIVEGTLVSPGGGADLRSLAAFEDFKLHIEFNCARGANSGVYLRGRYEVQIEDDAEPEAPTMRTGGVYGFLAPRSAVVPAPGQWRSYDITLIGRHVTVVLDGTMLIEDAEIPGITGGALDSREGEPGPIVLQGSEAGHVAFRNIVLTPALAEPPIEVKTRRGIPPRRDTLPADGGI